MTEGLIDGKQGGFRHVRKHRRKNIVYMGFIDLEKAYDRVNREALWLVLRMWVVNC